MQRSSSSNNNQMDRRENRSAKRSNPDTLSVNPTVPSLTPAQMYSNFEEWIKMCTDNKVNATNTWNFALIDYFHEMTFIREGDSINFQKASCTLDGCVKIYTSRVDSVATETGKLLSGLADSSKDGDQDDDTRQEKRARRKTHRSEATLLKDFSSISLKKFDLDFAVDPLFKKTSADFDEGGARGLLLNHLGMDQHCKIIFDASDATIECDTTELDGEGETHNEEEEEEEQVENEKADESESTKEKDEDDMDEEEPSSEKVEETVGTETELTKEPESEPMDIDGDEEKPPGTEEVPPITDTDKETSQPETPLPVAEEPVKEALVEISRLKAKLPTFEALSALNIVPSLKGFDFFSENDLEIPNLDHDDDDLLNENPMDTNEDAFHFDDYDIDYGADDIDPFAFDENNDNQEEEEEEQNDIDNTEKGYPEQDYLQAMLNNGEKELFNYFDTTLNQNWAGPQHWKLRRPPPPPVTDRSSEPDTEKPKRKPKVEFQIPFDEEEDEDEEELFAPPSRKVILSKEAIAKLTKQILPDDIHFSSKQLLQYFLKPMFPSGPKKKVTAIEPSATTAVPNDTGSDEPDINYWAEQTQDVGDTQDFGDFGDDVDYGYDPTDTYDNIDTTMMSSFDDRSFYHDNYDDPEVSVLYGDPLITNHNLKKTKPLYVNYARTAKRVDVKKLKDNLWKALTTVKPTTTKEPNVEEVEEKVHGVQKFTDIVTNLKKMYSPKTMRDISVPFCFICLLHLANEKDLSITGIAPAGQDDDDFVLGDNDGWMNNESILNEVTIVQN